METQTHPFEWALTEMRLWKEVVNLSRNGKWMSVFIQKVDGNSKMTRDYLCMKLTHEESTDSYIPWQPSQQDLLRGEWILA
jgi:hypothetical protein